MLRIGILLSGRGRGTNLQAILDACAAGTIPGQVNSSYPSGFAVAGDYVYFAANNLANGYELWRTNGTTAGTELVADLTANGSTYPYSMMAVDTQEGGLTVFFVGNNGAIQIHTGPVANIQPMGPWINVMDPTFHLHLRQDHITECWVVRKPTKDGHVTSLEAYDAKGEMIIQFFGKRKEGNVELAAWRDILDGLPRVDASVAA